MRGRFAPSPTGPMHLGNAYTALVSWLQVRAAGGQFLLRVEDLDGARCRAEHLNSILRDLEYLGLLWDEEPIFQSQRKDAYDQALRRLEQQGLTYPCFCSRAEIARATSAPHGPGDDGPRYPGTCATLSTRQARQRARQRQPAIRFRAQPAPVHFEDGIHGAHSEDVPSQVGDFLVCRNDGVASYQLAVVIDDAHSRISDVLRGDDLLSSTARQLQLYQALSLPTPQFAHIPLLVSPDGTRLAKREGAFSVSQLRASGVEAEQVIGLLGQWSGLHDGTPATAADLISRFSLDRVPRTPVQVTEEAVRQRLSLRGM